MSQLYYAQLVSGISAPRDAPAWLRQDMLNIKLALQNKITPAEFRTNLELGTISTQDSNNVSITGGSISGVDVTLGSVSGAYIRPKTIKETLSANRTLVSQECNRALLNPNGSSWNVVLWSSGTIGDEVIIKNTGTSGKLQIKHGSSNIALLLSGEVARFIYDGTATWERL